jgi:hypothetical protein
MNPSNGVMKPLISTDSLAELESASKVRVIEVDVSPAAYNTGTFPARCSGTSTRTCCSRTTRLSSARRLRNCLAALGFRVTPELWCTDTRPQWRSG